MNRSAGLNELAKLFSLDQQQPAQTAMAAKHSVTSSLDRRKAAAGRLGGSPGRMISKIQISNTNFPGNNRRISGVNVGVGFSKCLNDNEVNNDDNRTDDDKQKQKSSPYRTNLSVLRNLRKGGLI